MSDLARREVFGKLTVGGATVARRAADSSLLGAVLVPESCAVGGKAATELVSETAAERASVKRLFIVSSLPGCGCSCLVDVVPTIPRIATMAKPAPAKAKTQPRPGFPE